MFKSFKVLKEKNKKMKEEIINLKKLHGANVIEKFQNGDKNLILDLTEDNLYQPFSGKTRLNEDIFNYLDSYFFILKKLKRFNIEVKFNSEVKEEEKEEIIKKIKTRYIIDFEGASKKISESRRKAFISLIIGIIFLALNITFTYLFNNEILKEVIDIFAWVFIWEACDLYTFSSLNYSLDKAKDVKFYEANYIYDKGEINE